MLGRGGCTLTHLYPKDGSLVITSAETVLGGIDTRAAPRQRWHVGFEAIKALLAGLGRALAERTWLVGEHLTLADIMVAYNMQPHYLLVRQRPSGPQPCPWFANIPSIAPTDLHTVFCA